MMTWDLTSEGMAYARVGATTYTVALTAGRWIAQAEAAGRRTIVLGRCATEAAAKCLCQKHAEGAA